MVTRLGKSQKFRNVEEALAHENGKSVYWKNLLTSKKFWIKSAVFTAPVALVSSVFVTIFSVDDYLHDHSNELREIQENQSSYLSSILDMNNPWNKVNLDNPASFLLSFFIGADADILARLREVINLLDNDKLIFLTDLLSMIEMSDEQKSRFVILISTLLKSEDSLKKIPLLVDLLKRLEQAEKDSVLINQQLIREKGLASQSVSGNGEILAVAGEEGLNLSLLKLLTTDKPEALNFLLDTMLTLESGVYERLMQLIAKLGTTRTEKLLGILENLTTTDIRNLTNILSSIDTTTLRVAVDRLDSVPNTLVDDVISFAVQLNSNEVETLFEVTSSYSTTDFATFIDLHQDVYDSNIGDVFKIYQALGDSTAKSLVLNILDQLASKAADLNYIIEVLSDLPSQSQRNFVSSFKNISKNSLQDLPFIFRKLSGSVDKRRLVDESTYLNLSQTENIIEVFRDIDSGSVSKVLDISHNLSDRVNKVQLADQSYRIFSFDLNSASTGTRVSGSSYTAPRTVDDQNGENVLEGLVDQLYTINDKTLNADLLSASDDLGDLSLYRGAEVVTEIDLSTSDLGKPTSGLSKSVTTVRGKSSRKRGTRVHRLVEMHKKLKIDERASAIDTLHDIEGREYRKAAIDLVHYSDTDLIVDSITYTENLRSKLGDDEGLDASKRLVVLASRVNQESLSSYNSIRSSTEEANYSNLNDARQAGLNALQNERESRVVKILKQTTKEHDSSGLDTYEDGSKIIRITSLYQKLDTMDPKDNRFHRTRAAKLADALASSEGLTLGPSNETGVSREVSQETKIRRMDEYLNLDFETLWERRVIPLTDRAILVSHKRENNFEIPTPEKVNKDTLSKPRVILSKPTQKIGF